MTAWIWTVAGLLCLEVVGKLIMLVTGNFPTRTRFMVASDLTVVVVLIVWLAAVWK